jgi:hypothetical protein
MAGHSNKQEVVKISSSLPSDNKSPWESLLTSHLDTEVLL